MHDAVHMRPSWSTHSAQSTHSPDATAQSISSLLTKCISKHRCFGMTGVATFDVVGGWMDPPRLAESVSEPSLRARRAAKNTWPGASAGSDANMILTCCPLAEKTTVPRPHSCSISGSQRGADSKPGSGKLKVKASTMLFRPSPGVGDAAMLHDSKYSCCH